MSGPKKGHDKSLAPSHVDFSKNSIVILCLVQILFIYGQWEKWESLYTHLSLLSPISSLFQSLEAIYK